MSDDDTRSMTADEEELIARAAWLYYREKLTQEEIGEALQISRVKVSRLIDKGHKVGLVQVHINSRFQNCVALESRLKKLHHLADAVVVPATGADGVNEGLGQAAAEYLARHARGGTLLAIGWGDTVTRALSRAAYYLSEKRVSLISLTGGVSTYLQSLVGFQPNVGRTAVHLIPAPILASSAEVAAAIKHEPQVREVIAMVHTADIALVGIGAPADDATLVTTGYVSPDELTLYRRRGAVGDVLGQFFDADGAILDLPLHGRITGVGISELRQIPLVVGVAGGEHKLEAIRAALKGRHVNVLITDEATAEKLCGAEQRDEGQAIA